MYHDDFLLKKLDKRSADNAFRILKLPAQSIDFCSNDYLGIAFNNLLQHTSHGQGHGSTGSRLLAGNYELIEDTESHIAAFHNSEAALIFNSGYDANVGLLSSVPQKGDTIYYDQLVHASIRDGIRLSNAQAFSFVHNDLADLEKKLALGVGTLFVVTESVFSMDGDMCPLQEVLCICKKHNAHLILDEAHALGVVGSSGEGLAQSLGLHEECFSRIYTFGKACGCHGAVITGSKRLRDYLINFARSLIFSTALPPASVAAIQEGYRLISMMQNERAHLQQLIAIFQKAEVKYPKLTSSTPIQGVVIEGNDNVKQVANMLQQNGLDVRPILYPTVQKGKERLRIVLHSFNTVAQLQQLIGLLS